ncbi:MAG: ATP12 family protein [Pseudomonadota bacterium]
MKRFFKTAQAAATGGAYHVLLDDKPIKTPCGAAFALPTQALAQAVAAEWQACGEVIKPADLLLTQLSNTALDRTAAALADLRKTICAYGETDLLCYRADRPNSLVEAQSHHWDPPLKWLRAQRGISLTTTTAFMGHRQPEGTLAKLDALIAPYDAFSLTALHQVTALTGSLVLAAAFAQNAIDPQAVWAAATVDERYQSERWGEDKEAKATLEKKRLEFLAAVSFWTNLSTTI